jgi:hypothetical protein
MLSALLQQFNNDAWYKQLDRLLPFMETKISGIKFIGRGKPDSLEDYSPTDHIAWTLFSASEADGQQRTRCGTTAS